MSLYKQFKMDDKKQAEGILLNYGANSDGSVPSFRVLRRGPSNQKYQQTLERETRPYRRQIELGTLDNMQSEYIYRRVFCLSVLIGWEHVQTETGEEIPFNFENAMKLFGELPELYDDLIAQSSKAALFIQSTLEGDTKN